MEAFSTSILGSPFLDVTLGQVDAVQRVLQDLSMSGKKLATDDAYESDEDGLQPDSILPPGNPDHKTNSNANP